MTMPLKFEPHNGYGMEIDGERMPFGYISGGNPTLPIFELNPVLMINPETLQTLALLMAAAPSMAELIKDIAETPKHGEPCPDAPEFQQSWEDECGRYAIDRLHDIIDAARAAVAKVTG